MRGISITSPACLSGATRMGCIWLVVPKISSRVIFTCTGISFSMPVAFIANSISLTRRPFLAFISSNRAFPKNWGVRPQLSNSSLNPLLSNTCFGFRATDSLYPASLNALPAGFPLYSPVTGSISFFSAFFWRDTGIL